MSLLSRRVAVAGFCAVLVACSLTTDLSGLSGGPLDPSDVEGGTDASGNDAIASGQDAGTDTSTTDASVPPFCASHPGHTVCVDFDDGKLPTNWMKDVSAGSVGWSSTRAASLPGAMLATIPRRPAGDKENATLRRAFPGWKHIVVEFDMFMEKPDWQMGDVNTGIFDIDLYGASNSYFVTFSAGEQYITMGTPGDDGQVLMPIPFGTWFHAKIDFDPGGSVHAELGTRVLDKSFPAVPSDATPTTNVNIGINGYNAPVPQFSAYYDNITIDFP